MNFDELLKSLHKEYLTSLPSKIDSIAQQAIKGSAAELRESFHKLKGTGRTYGMPEVSELATLVEDLCAEFPKKRRGGIESGRGPSQRHSPGSRQRTTART